MPRSENDANHDRFEVLRINKSFGLGWWWTEPPPEEGRLRDLDGVLKEENDVYKNEYPIIEAVNIRAAEEMGGFSDEAAAAIDLDD